MSELIRFTHDGFDTASVSQDCPAAGAPSMRDDQR